MSTEVRGMIEKEKGEAEVLLDNYIEKERMIESREEVLLGLQDGEDEEVPLPGFRFRPTDEELVGFYLRRKVEKKKLSIDIIKQLDVYKYDPWDLAKQSTFGVGENEWYFFCQRKKKYRNSVRPNRVTGSGYWKATGVDKKIIFPPGTNNCVGLKKSLVYYCGKGGKGTKTYWMMHEFRLPPKGCESSENIKFDEAREAENWAICKIFLRNVSSPKKSPPEEEKDFGERRNPTPTDHSNPISSVVRSTDSEDKILVHLLSETSVQKSTEQTKVDANVNHYQQGCAMVADIFISDDPFPNILSPFGMDDLDLINWDDIEIPL